MADNELSPADVLAMFTEMREQRDAAQHRAMDLRVSLQRAQGQCELLRQQLETCQQAMTELRTRVERAEAATGEEAGAPAPDPTEAGPLVKH